MVGYINISSMCWELENVMSNNFNGSVTKENFNSKFEKAKKELIQQLSDAIEDNRPTMREEFGL